MAGILPMIGSSCNVPSQVPGVSHAIQES